MMPMCMLMCMLGSQPSSAPLDVDPSLHDNTSLCAKDHSTLLSSLTHFSPHQV